MTEIMPVPRKLRITVLPAGGFMPAISFFRDSEEKLTTKATLYFNKDEFHALIKGLSDFETQFTEYAESHQNEKLGYTHFHFGDFYKFDDESESRDIVVYVNLDE